MQHPSYSISLTFTLLLEVYLFLGAFVKFRKATISFVTTVCQTARMEELGSHWVDFHEILYLHVFRKSAQKIQISLKADKNNEYFTRRPRHLFDRMSLSSS